MEIDWTYVKKITLWQYEDLVKKILIVLKYDFVQEHYSHTMSEAVAYSEKIRQNYLQNGKEPTFIIEITKRLKELDGLGIKDYQYLMQKVDTKAKCENFLEKTDFGFNALIQVLNYLFRWVLPFTCPIRELLDTFSETDTSYVKIFKKYKIRFNLDVLKTLRTKVSRKNFSGETGIAEKFLLSFVHRSDISRIAYVRGKTIKHLCGGGYDTLTKIAAADIKEMEVDMTKYYASIGKSFLDFNTVIPLDWMIGGAKILPRVIDA